MRSPRRLLLALPLLLLAAGFPIVCSATTATYTGEVERVTAAPLDHSKRWHVPCSAQYAENGMVEGCHPTDCKRVLHDGFITREEVDRLIGIADTAMELQSASKAGGPCIADINSGAWVRGCV
jgi:hypothetical protein